MADSQKSNKDTVIRARVDRETVDGIQKIYDEITK